MIKLKSKPIFLSILALLFVSLACRALTGTESVSTPAPQQPEPQEAEPQQPTPTEAADPTQEPIETAAVKSQGAGILCVGSGTGLSCLDESGWQIYTDENSGLPNNYLYAGTLCPDGQIAIAHISGVVLFDGETWKEIPESDTYNSPEAISCDAKGGIWVAHFRGVSHYSDGQWTLHGSENLASGESANELVYDIEVAPDGKVWVVTSRSVAMFENNAWTVFQEGQGFDDSRFFDALALDASGHSWAAHSSGVDVFENDAWQSFDKSDYSSSESLAIDPQGQVWLGTLIDGVYLFDGNTWAHYDQASEHVLSNHVTSISADSGGRIWLGTTYGLTVFDGADWQTLLMSNSELGDNNVRFVIVTNDGPSLPALEERASGSLTGRLEDPNGSPLADVPVEICVETIGSTFSGDTPCSDQPFFLSTQTDADGAFLFEDVPAGYYVIVAETSPDSWAQFTDQFGISSERTLIPAGEQYDIGTLTVEE